MKGVVAKDSENTVILVRDRGEGEGGREGVVGGEGGREGMVRGGEGEGRRF